MGEVLRLRGGLAVEADTHVPSLEVGLASPLVEDSTRCYLARGGRHWMFQYLFAKKDRADIDADELDGFRKLAKLKERLTARQLDELVEDGELEEICHGDEA